MLIFSISLNQIFSIEESFNARVGDERSFKNYTIKFNANDIPVFYDSTGTVISASPPSSITLSWNESSGTTDDDSIYNGNMSAGVGIITDGILSTTDDDGLLTSQSVTAGDLSLQGALAKSKSLNGKVTIFCNGNEVIANKNRFNKWEFKKFHCQRNLVAIFIV